jgi:sugar phosphate isomerase/epimerase
MSWRIGISTGACTDLPILDILPAIHAAGAAGVEIGTPPNHFDPWDEQQILSVERGLHAHQLEAISIHTPFGGLLDLADSNPHHRHAAIGAALTSSMALRHLGGRLVVVHPSDRPRHDQDVQGRLTDAARSLALLADNCMHASLTLVVESPLPHLIGGDPDEFAFLLKDLPPSVGVCLDTGHTALGRHWRRFMEVAGKRLMHIHANDNRGSWDDHLPPGEGDIDWAEISRSLRDADFDGWIMLELACPGATPMVDYLSHAYAKAKALFG